ncbi:hypothetical protein AXA44_36655 [Rhodococcus sp. SC4]|nr:hypothetical protein AXA44_36655 [Rhodococcus sp. SC4]
MSYAPGEDAEALRGVVRDFLDKRSSESEVRRLMESPEGYDPDVWHRGAAELGLNGLTLPETYGGSDAGMVELGVVFEEMGRSLLCSPFFPTVAMAAWALMESSDPAARDRYLPGIASGETIATLGWGGTDPLASAVTATEGPTGWRLDGRADYVVFGSTATLVLVIAETTNGPSLFAVSADEGVTRTSLIALDSTRGLSHLDFDNAPAKSVDSTADTLQRALDRSSLLLAAEQLGGAQHTLEMAVEYAKNRVQFGRRIGSFQAIKHRCADLLVEVESARSVVWHGLWNVDQDDANLPVAAALAKAVCSEVYVHVAAENIQIHGGIGFTWEHPAHLYLKRAKSSQLLFGSDAAQRSRLATLLGVPEGV